MYCENYKQLGITQKAFEMVCELETELKRVFHGIEEVENLNEAKVLNAFLKNKVAAHYFNPTTGYGYDDIGREGLDRVFADVFEAEAAVVSPHLISGTHAIYCVLAGLLLPGDTLLAVSGQPYDTLLEAIGIEGNAEGSLREFGIRYESVDLLEDGNFDMPAIREAVSSLKPKVVHVQRSRGYAWREAIRPENMEKVFNLIKNLSPETIIAVDNCYGEFLIQPSYN